MYDPVVQQTDADLASRIVWFDAYVTNVDRTARNTNMLMWHKRLWLIDHGASLFFHHSPGWETADRARAAFPLIKEHVLLRQATKLAELDASIATLLTAGQIRAIVDLVPDGWLTERDAGIDPARARDAYVRYLTERLDAPRAFVEEAIRVQ